MLLMIDNYDSFTYNLVQYFGELGAKVHTVRNDQISLDDIDALEPERIVLSPGPCTPTQAGISNQVVQRYGGKIPLLGVCLGHQCIGEVYGGHVVRAAKVMHGKTSMIYHHSEGVFADLPNPFEATRYHSLIIAADSVPASLEVTAWTQDDNGERQEIMGLRHRSLCVEGVQFHPESILTRCGHQLLGNFLNSEIVSHA